MVNFQIIKEELKRIYGDEIIHVNENKQSLNEYVSCHIPKCGKKMYDIVVSIKGDYAVIFNNMIRKKFNAYSEYFRGTKINWEKLINTDICITNFYGCIRDKNKKMYYHKYLIMKIDFLFENRYQLYDLLQFSVDDNDIPISIKAQLNKEFARKNITVTRKARDAKFRELVLSRYNYKCAICRCSEKEILQAAHIKAVSLDGSDDPSNGICLCANHHLMFDNGLIKINFNSKEIIVLRESIRTMIWYKEFLDKYKGKILDIDKNDFSKKI